MLRTHPGLVWKLFFFSPHKHLRVLFYSSYQQEIYKDLHNFSCFQWLEIATKSSTVCHLHDCSIHTSKYVWKTLKPGPPYQRLWMPPWSPPHCQCPSSSSPSLSGTRGSRWSRCLGVGGKYDSSLIKGYFKKDKLDRWILPPCRGRTAAYHQHPPRWSCPGVLPRLGFDPVTSWQCPAPLWWWSHLRLYRTGRRPPWTLNRQMKRRRKDIYTAAVNMRIKKKKFLWHHLTSNLLFC